MTALGLPRKRILAVGLEVALGRSPGRSFPPLMAQSQGGPGQLCPPGASPGGTCSPGLPRPAPRRPAPQDSPEQPILRGTPTVSCTRSLRFASTESLFCYLTCPTHTVGEAQEVNERSPDLTASFLQVFGVATGLNRGAPGAQTPDIRGILKKNPTLATPRRRWKPLPR